MATKKPSKPMSKPGMPMHKMPGGMMMADKDMPMKSKGPMKEKKGKY